MSTRFLTIADVAEQLQLSAQAVRALIRTGDLPAIQVGARKLWRIEDQALEDYSVSSPRPGPWWPRAGSRTRSPEHTRRTVSSRSLTPLRHLHTEADVSDCAAPRSPRS